MNLLLIDQFGIGYGDRVIVEDLNILIFKGKIIILIGLNGCGKLMILKIMFRIMCLYVGIVYLNGKVIYKMFIKDIVKDMVILLQIFEVLSGLMVYELVLYGRFLY